MNHLRRYSRNRSPSEQILNGRRRRGRRLSVETLESRQLLAADSILSFDFETDQGLAQLQADGWRVDSEILDDQDGIDDLRAINGVLELTDDRGTAPTHWAHDASYEFGAVLQGRLQIAAGTGGSYNGNPSHRIDLNAGTTTVATIAINRHTAGRFETGAGTTSFSDSNSFRDEFRNYVVQWKADAGGINGSVSMSFEAADGSLVEVVHQPFLAEGVPDTLELSTGFSSAVDMQLRVDSIQVDEFNSTVAPPTGPYFDIAYGSVAGDRIAGRVNLTSPVSVTPQFQIVGGSGAGLFEIATVTNADQDHFGELAVAAGVTMDAVQTYTLDVEILDGPTVSETQSIQVRVVGETAATKIFQALLNGVRYRAADIDDATVTDWMSKIQSDGSFSDLATSDTTALTRLSSLAEAYAFNPTYQGDLTLRSKIYDAIVHWSANVNFNNANWTNLAWNWPRHIGIVGYFLLDDLRAERQSIDLAVRERAWEVTDAMLGASETVMTNRKDSQEHYWGGNLGYRLQAMQLRAITMDDYNRPITEATGFQRGFVPTANFADIAYLTEKSFEPSLGPDLVGLTADGGFSQHAGGGAQLFTFGYARDWASDVLSADLAFAGTPWTLQQPRYDQMADYLLDGAQWQVYENQGDYLAMGRRAGRTTTSAFGDAASLTRDLLHRLTLAAGPTPLTRLDEVTAARDAWDSNEGQNLIGTRAFWNHDFLVHRTDEYYISTKMNSVRSSGNETGNDENLPHYHMGDGTTLIMQTGDEYMHARVGWDWHQLPGTTLESRTDTLPIREWNSNNEGLNTFAGVVANGLNGISAFINDRYDAGRSAYQYHTVNSNKATFFFTDGLLALGSDIHRVAAGQNQAIKTTLNQTEWLSDVKYDIGDGIETVSRGTYATTPLNLTRPSWFHHDGIGYVILPTDGVGVDVVLETRATNNNWRALDTTNADETQAVDVFQLAIDHGNNPSDEKYQYLIVPNRTAAEMPDYVAQLKVEVVANTPSVQAVRNQDDDVTQAVFYEAGSVTIGEGLTLTSDQPALVILSRTNGDVEVTVADPMHSTSTNQINLTITERLSGDQVTWDPDAGYSTINAMLSNEVTRAGESVTLSAQAPAVLNLVLSEAAINEDGTLTGTVFRPNATTEELIVSLLSNDVSEATVPATITIAAGETSSDFTIQTLPDSIIDGTQIVTITASAVDHDAASADLDVLDGDPQVRWVYPGIDSRLIYRPDAQGDRVPDFADVGYKGGRESIPDVPIVVTVAPGAGDDTARIQAAIDQVAAMPLGVDGFRGAVLLQQGDYDVDTQIVISASGIVLRGEGRGESGTVLHARGDDRRELIKVDGSGSMQLFGSATTMTDFVVPVGARSFRVADASGLQAGDTIRITRHGNQQWIDDLGMDQLTNPWQPESKNIQFEREITRVDGDTITVDVPLVDAFELRYGGGTIQKFRFDGRIENVGIEDIRGESDFDSDVDEDHSWDFITINRTRDAWVRRTTAQYFAYSHVSVQRNAQRVTISDAISLDPKSIITGGRRYSFNIVGQQNLVTRSLAYDGRHDFVLAAQVAGPNVFHDSTAVDANSDSGPHHRWSTGGLFDNIVTDNELDAENRLNSGTGHGWAGANMVFYNSTADGFNVHNPTTSQNWVIGSTGAQRAGNFTSDPPQGNFDSHGTPVSPDSLYEAQLAQRNENDRLEYRELWLGDIDDISGNPDPSVDRVDVNPSWLAAAPGTTSSFDELESDRWVPFSFGLDLLPVDELVGATLALGLRGANANTSDDQIYLEDYSQPRSFNSLGWTVTSTTDGYVLDLGNDLDLLEDGVFNVAIHGDTAIDWAVLTFQVITGETVTYVDDSFIGADNDVVADADLGTQGDQPGVIGVNAFRTISEAVAATAGNGTIVVNDGNYPEDVILLASQTLRVAGPDASQSILIDSINGPRESSITLQGSVELGAGGDSSVGRLIVQFDRPTAETLTLPAGHTLVVSGDLTVGVAGTEDVVTNWNVTGGGELRVDNPSGLIEFGLANSSNSSPENSTTVDLTGLGAFVADVDGFRVGFGSRNRSALLFSDISNRITAETFSVADSDRSNSRPASVTLGNGTNVIHANHLHVGLSKGDGTLAFASQAAGGTGTLTVRGREGGESTANIVVAQNTDTATGVSPKGQIDLRGHAVDVIADSLVIAHRTRGGGGGITGSLSIDQGMFVANSIAMASRSDGDGIAQATLNVGGGMFSVNGGGSFQLAEHTGGGTAIGTIHLTGGTLTTHVDITDEGGMTSTSFNLDGGTLNLNQNSLGGVIPIDSVELNSGTLENVRELNDGVIGIAKSSLGAITLAGTNTHSAATNISDAELIVTGTHSGGGDYTISGNGVLAGTGSIQSSVAMNGNAALAPGLLPSPMPGTLTVGGNVSLGSNNTLAIDLINETSFDQLNIVGAGRSSNLGEANLSFNFAASPTPGMEFVIVDNVDRTSVINGLFSFDGVLLANGDHFTVADTSFQIVYDGGLDGNDVVIMVTEPANLPGPTVEKLKVGSSEWPWYVSSHLDRDQGHGFEIPWDSDQLKSLSWEHIDTIYVSFSEDVSATFTAANIALEGIEVANYADRIDSVAYDADTNTGIVTLNQPIRRDRLRLTIRDDVTNSVNRKLDGEFVNESGVDRSGNGIEGGDFEFLFHVLPGDLDGDGMVTEGELSIYESAYFTQPGEADYDARADVNGDGLVTIGDLQSFSDNFGSGLPAGAFSSDGADWVTSSFSVVIQDEQQVVSLNGTEVMRTSVGEVVSLSGTSANDTFAIASSSRLNLSGGQGVDTLVPSASRSTINLSGMRAAGGLAEVEVIDLRNQDATNFNVNSEDIRQIAPTSKTLVVYAGTDDRIEVGDEFKITNVRRGGGQLYVIARSSDTILQIGGMGWTNPLDRNDVDNSGHVSALDALKIINKLIETDPVAGGDPRLPDPTSLDQFPMQFYDTSGDGQLSALDALRVINQLNGRVEGVGEAIDGIADSPMSPVETTREISFLAAGAVSPARASGVAEVGKSALDRLLTPPERSPKVVFATTNWRSDQALAWVQPLRSETEESKASPFDEALKDFFLDTLEGEES